MDDRSGRPCYYKRWPDKEGEKKKVWLFTALSVSLLVTNVSLQQGLFESDLFLATFASHILATCNVFEKQCSMAQGRPEGAVILAAQAVIFAFSYQVHFMLINSCISYKICYDSGERESGSS
jgi:hypothetical protein